MARLPWIKLARETRGSNGEFTPLDSSSIESRRYSVEAQRERLLQLGCRAFNKGNQQAILCSSLSPRRQEPRAHRPLTVPEADRTAFITHNFERVAAPHLAKSEVAIYSDTFSATNEM